MRNIYIYIYNGDRETGRDREDGVTVKGGERERKKGRGYYSEACTVGMISVFGNVLQQPHCYFKDIFV